MGESICVSELHLRFKGNLGLPHDHISLTTFKRVTELLCYWDGCPHPSHIHGGQGYSPHKIDNFLGSYLKVIFLYIY